MAERTGISSISLPCHPASVFLPYRKKTLIIKEVRKIMLGEIKEVKEKMSGEVEHHSKVSAKA